MILVDTSVWVDHLRRGDLQLQQLLHVGRVLVHPFVVGELACGTLAYRSSVLELLQALPQATVADVDEVLEFVVRHSLHGKGVGYVDVHLLASTALTHDAELWTRDRRLLQAAETMKRSFAGGKLH